MYSCKETPATQAFRCPGRWSARPAPRGWPVWQTGERAAEAIALTAGKRLDLGTRTLGRKKEVSQIADDVFLAAAHLDKIRSGLMTSASKASSSSTARN